MSDGAIPWLTDPHRELLAHLTVVTLLPQMQERDPGGGYTYERMRGALADIAEAGDMTLRGDAENVWVLIRGKFIAHAARDWLEYMAPRWAGATQN